MKGLLTLIRQDLLLAWRNGLVLSTAVLLGIMGALVLFLPAEVEAATTQVVFDASEDRAYEHYLRANRDDTTRFVASEEALAIALADLERGFGIVYSGPTAAPTLRLLTVGNLSAENINVARAALAMSVAAMQGNPVSADYTIETLRPAASPIPLNLNVVPVAIVFEVVLLGFLFGAVMIFEEKQEGVNRALRVTPLTTAAYIWAKNFLFLGLSLLYGGLLLFLAFQFQADYGRILLLILLTSSLMTFGGLTIAVFFNNLSEWFFAGVGVLLLFNLPLLSYALPNFMPTWITWIPAFPVLFGAREILFPTGQSDFFLPLVAQLLAYNALAYALCYLAVERRLLSAGQG